MADLVKEPTSVYLVIPPDRIDTQKTWLRLVIAASHAEDVEKILAEEKAVEHRKKRLVADLLKQREAVINDFDEKLAKLGYHPDGKSKRNHHRKSAAPAQQSQKDRSKA